MKLYLNVCYGGLEEQIDLTRRLAKSDTVSEEDRQQLLGINNLLKWILWGFEKGYHPISLEIPGTDDDFRRRPKNEPRKTVGYPPKIDPLTGH